MSSRLNKTAESYKEQGNTAFQRNDMHEAIRLYTEAIREQESEVYYCNRAAAYGRNNEWKSSLADTTAALKLNPKYHKAILRHVEALIRCGKPLEAKDYLDPFAAAELDRLRQAQGITDTVSGVTPSPLLKRCNELSEEIVRCLAILYGSGRGSKWSRLDAQDISNAASDSVTAYSFVFSRRIERCCLQMALEIARFAKILATNTNVIGGVSTPSISIVTTKQRYESRDLEQKFDLERARLEVAAEELRENLDKNVGIDRLRDDLAFAAEHMLASDEVLFAIVPALLLCHIYNRVCASLLAYEAKPVTKLFSGSNDEGNNSTTIGTGPKFLQQMLAVLQRPGVQSRYSHSSGLWAFYKVLNLLAQENDNNLNEATSTCSTALRLDPDNKQVLSTFKSIKDFISNKDNGAKAYATSNYIEARMCFQKALDNLFSLDFAINLEKILALPPTYEQNSADTIAAEEAGHEAFPRAIVMLCTMHNAAQVFSNYGMCLQKESKTAESLGSLATATFLDPKYSKAHTRAAQIYLDSKMYEEALREAGAAASIAETPQAVEIAKKAKKALEKYSRKDYYSILGVDKNIDTNSKEYQKQYKKMCLKWHPDRHRDPVDKKIAEKRFRLLQEADQVLTNKEKRNIYDHGGDPINGASTGGMSTGFPGMGMGMPGGQTVFVTMNGRPVQMEGGSMGGIDLGSLFSMFGGFN